ncbi:MAG: hypothetical protein B6I24_06870 [Bacteroidetes bacterium 4572_128]|nr:MAG: hypothetical protein B6I24_06870 [Bacteroidetes bacterium 4572_128]
MNIELLEISCLHEKGKRESNEDAIFPKKNKANLKNKLFVVCDGVGGVDKGEVASRLICEKFAEYFNKNINNIQKKNFEKAFNFVEEEIALHIKKNPETDGMASTAAILFIDEKGIFAMHCGDTRISHFRNNKILWQSEDHSWVWEMLKRGILTKEEAKNHRRKNIITRAMQGKKESEPDIYFTKDIEKNDYFLITTDGIHDIIGNKELTKIVFLDNNLKNKMKKIHKICDEKSNDNFSAYIFKIKDINNNNFFEKMKNIFS